MFQLFMSIQSKSMGFETTLDPNDMHCMDYKTLTFFFYIYIFVFFTQNKENDD